MPREWSSPGRGCTGGGTPLRPCSNDIDRSDVLNGSVRPVLRSEPRESSSRAGRLEDQHMDVRARVPRGVRVPKGELVEQEQGVLVRANPEGCVHVDPEPP